MIDVILGILKNIEEFKGMVKSANKNQIRMHSLQVFEILYVLEKKRLAGEFDRSGEEVLELIEILDFKIPDQISLQISLVASKIKSLGGVSPYDALLIAEVQNTPNAVLLTKDSEFVKKGFENIIFVN